MSELLNLIYEAQELLLPIIERNTVNKAKKEEWENKLNNITPAEKAEKTEKIKKLADLEKDDKKIANLKNDNFFLDLANRMKEIKNEEINNFSKKFKNRKEIKESLSDKIIYTLIEGSTPGEQEVKTKVQKAGKKGEKNDKVEMVSVEDALFPYQGNNKEQLTQKIVNKINELIEGKATLADLIQFVRQNTKRVRMK